MNSFLPVSYPSTTRFEGGHWPFHCRTVHTDPVLLFHSASVFKLSWTDVSTIVAGCVLSVTLTSINVVLVVVFCAVPEVPDSAFHRRRDHPRQQHEPDLRATWNYCRESNRRDVSHRSPHPCRRPRISKVWRFSNRLWLVSPDAHPGEQSVSNVNVHVIP